MRAPVCPALAALALLGSVAGCSTHRSAPSASTALTQTQIVVLSCRSGSLQQTMLDMRLSMKSPPLDAAAWDDLYQRVCDLDLATFRWHHAAYEARCAGDGRAVHPDLDGRMVPESELYAEFTAARPDLSRRYDELYKEFIALVAREANGRPQAASAAAAQ